MIKQILDEIAALSGKNDKRDALTEHKDNELLKEVIYQAHSPRIKFYIKQIPEPNRITRDMITLKEAIADLLEPLEIPVSYGLSFGHIKKMVTIPNGIKARLNADRNNLKLLESAVL